MGTKKVFFPNLDGLRFFAFFAVFLAHSLFSKFEHINQNDWYLKVKEITYLGIFGVNFFFVLSGFLITYLLLEEKTVSETINVPNFYIRRILRIWPLYYLIVIIGFVFVPLVQQRILGNVDYEEKADIYAFLFFYNNYSSIVPTSAVLGVLWSIAVEEQFYLIWPLLIKFVPIRKTGYLCLSLVIASFFIRSFWLGYGFNNLLSCISDLAVGGGLAYLCFTQASWIENLKSMKKVWILVVYFVGMAIILNRSLWADIYYLYVNERLVFSLFFAFIILEQNTFENSFVKWKNCKWISETGKFTYGLYMYHFVIIYIVSVLLNKLAFNTQMYQVMVVAPSIALFLAIFVSALSYRYFEKPLLQLKDRFAIIVKGNG